MSKNDKTESVIIPKWLQNIFMLGISLSVLAGIIASVFFLKIGYIWITYIPFIAPFLIAIVVFFVVLDKQKPLMHRLFFALFFYEIVNLLGTLVYYASSYFVRFIYMSSDTSMRAIFYYGAPSVLYAIFCLILVFVYRKKIREL